MRSEEKPGRQEPRRHLRRLGFFLLAAGSASLAPAGRVSAQEWAVGGGAGAVIRTFHQGSFGLNLQVSRVFQPARAFYLETGLSWQGYRHSVRGGDLCPLEGCPPPLEDAISIFGPELRLAYREPESNPVYPVGGLGVYRVSSQDTSGVRVGVNVGLAISLRSSGWGPALDFRYFHVFDDRRFKSVVPVAVRWSF
jgi:hypothetical protein